MSLLPESGFGDQQLVRYLLCLLPDEDAERLDEMSIVDDDLAWRLRAVEYDLVDGYVHGTLSATTRERFESFYLSSARRRQNVQSAGSFLGLVARQADRADAVARPDSRRIWLRSTADWGLAAAAALFLLAGGALLLRDVGLQNGLNEAQRRAGALDRRTRELERQLEDQRATRANAVDELERVRSSKSAPAQPSAAVPPPGRTGAAARALTTIALVLLPQTRAPGPIAALTVPEGTDDVTFELRLESNRFPRYQVALKDPARDLIVWRSSRLTATSPDDQPAVSTSVPARLLKAQHYSLDLIGRSADGGAHVLGSYAVRIVR